jgi:competence protein ComEC
MINVNHGIPQGDAHLLEMPEGSRLMIDVADSGQGAVAFLKQRGITRLDAVVISHPHKDHYGALPELLSEGIKIGTVFINVPPPEVCDGERPWGCDMPHIRRVLAECSQQGVRVRRVSPGDVLFDKAGAKLETLYAFDGVNTPIGRTDVNDTSLILRLSYGTQRALFTGDLNEPMGAWLAANGRGLEADILKVPHHAATGVAPNAFFRRVRARVALVPAPRELWESERDARVRDELRSAGVDVWVNGLHGNVTVLLGRRGFEVRAEAAP